MVRLGRRERPAGPADRAELRLAWTDRRVGGLSPDDVYASSFSSSAVPGTETLVSTGAPSHLGVDAAPGPAGEFLTAYRSDVSGVQRILVQRVDGTGAPMDAFPTDVGNGSALSYPSVAWDGSRYLVVWGNGGNIYGRRVSAAGVPIDGAEFLIMPGVSPDVAGLNGRFAVVGAHWATSTQFYFPFGLRVDGATAALLDAPILLGQYFCRAPAVIAFDNRWLVMWQRNFSHDDVQAELSGAFLLQDGTPTTEFRNFGALGPGYTPSLATAGSEALVVYRTGSQSAADQSISALRVLPGAAAPLPTSHVISNAPDRQAEPSVTWTGTEYCAVWQDKRDAAFFFDERTNVYGARIDGAGTVLDPTGVPIETDAVPEALPLIVSDGTSSLFLSSRFESAAPFAAYLVGVRTLVAVTTAVPIGPVPGTALQLAPAAPNPFTATTSLRFTLPSAGAFRLDVYDIAGRHVRTLLNGTLPAGEHVTTWDGRSDEGAPLATGVYLVRLASDRGRRTERVLRLR